MKRIFTLCAVLLAVAGMWAQKTPNSIVLTPQERELVQNNNDFAFRLFRQVRTDKSQLLSPLSVTYALGMLNNGAQGQTLKEINKVLGFGEAGSDAINQFCHKLQTESADLDKETKVSIANNIYINEGLGFQLKKPFVEKAAKYYDVTPEARDFADGKTLDVINQWGSDHTEGMIPEVLGADEFDPLGASYLLNALYFKGVWQQKFDKQNTMKTYFNYDQNLTCDMMHTEGEFSYAANSTYQSVVLPYGNGAYQMTVFLPKYGKTLDDVLSELNGKNWNVDKYDTYKVFLGLPRFETETTQYLEEILPQLGIVNAFGGEGFTEFCYQGKDETQAYPFQIELMKQVAKIKLDEEGSEAAAVTVIGNKSATTKSVEFMADRPFLYIISEQSTGAIFFMGQYMGNPIDNPRGTISLTEEEKELVQNNNDFAFDLFRQARTGNDMMLSPLSITYALGMLNNGAAGQTQEEINKVLGASTDASKGGGKGADAINAFCRKMLTEATKLDKGTTVGIANTIFVNEALGFKLQPTFVEKAQQFYDATPQARDFFDGQTMDVINQWGNDHTNGMVPRILTEDVYNPYSVSYLLNAIYFKGMWKNKFRVENTMDEPFNGKENVPMMHISSNVFGGGGKDTEFAYTQNDLYQAVKLPYGNEAYQMTVFLPREGKTIGDVLEKLDAKNWDFRGSHYSIDLKLPRFETTTDQNLKPVMQALGINQAFTPAAEFPYFCIAADANENYIGMMKQSSKIKVDEEGTEAAAVTIIGMETTSMPPYAEFHANRPFLYVISEQSTGTIFFIGQFTNGTGEARETNGIGNAPRQNDKEGTWYNLKGQRLSTPPAHGVYIQGGKLMTR